MTNPHESDVQLGGVNFGSASNNFRPGTNHAIMPRRKLIADYEP